MNKILHIITGLDNGGAEAVLFRFVINDKSNTHIVVSLKDYGKYGQLLEDNNILIYKLDIKSIIDIFISFFKLGLIIKKNKPNIVQTWMYHSDLFGGITAKLFGIKKIYWGIHNSTISHETKKTTRFIIKINSFFSKIIPNKIISCSKKAIESHISMGFDSTKFKCVNNGYSSFDFFPDKILRENFRNKHNLSNNIFTIGMIARYDKQKDPINFFNAIKKLKNNSNINFKCVLVGIGMDETNKEMIDILSKYNILENFIFVGQSSEINYILNGLDLIVLSSKYGEAFPNVIAESMLTETPCLATDVGDTATLISDTGWVIPPNNSDILFNNIVLCYQEYTYNVDLWRNKSINARLRIQNNFTIEMMVNNYNKIWNNILCVD